MLNIDYLSVIYLQIKEERLRKLFSEKGVVTNCNLKYTSDGVFRKFAFIGYKTESAATNAIKYFNNTFIDTNKIIVCEIILLNYTNIDM